MSEKVLKIWEEFNGRLKQFILSRINDEASAEDILQDVFTKIHSRISTLRDNSKLRSWIYQIERNAIMDHYRNQKMKDGLKSFQLSDDPVNDRARDEMNHCIRVLIDSLPPHDRTPIVLTTFHDLTQKEIAAKLGVSLSGAKSRVQRARRKLKNLLIESCHYELESLGISINYQPICACCCESNQSLKK